MQIDRKQLIIDYRAREWCKLPYPDHPQGCPNFNHKATCPPQVCLIDKYIDLDKPIHLVFEEFNLGWHILHMKSVHPKWSDRQARCVLYWQNGVNARLEEKCKMLSFQLGGLIYTTCPEAMGVNVIKTVKQLGVPISTHPINKVIKVGLVGQPCP